MRTPLALKRTAFAAGVALVVLGAGGLPGASAQTAGGSRPVDVYEVRREFVVPAGSKVSIRVVIEVESPKADPAGHPAQRSRQPERERPIFIPPTP